MRAREHQVVVVAFDGMQLLDIAGPAAILDAATTALGSRPGYRVVVASPNGRPVRTAGGMRIGADTALCSVRPRSVDTIILGGGMNVKAALTDTRLIGPLGALSAGARRTCSVCTGAFLLASAGLLDGRRATTHWAFCAALARQFPHVSVEPDRIYVRDGTITTSAGVTAGMDLALALVADDHGSEIARTVARWTIMFLQRPGGQSQFSERLALPTCVSTPLRTVVDEIVANPAGDHRQVQLARRAALSDRHLRRLFAEQTQTTPARFVERVRVEAARDLLESTTGPIERIAACCGFGSAETMRRAFLRTTGVGPNDYRERFQTIAPGPWSPR